MFPEMAMVEGNVVAGNKIFLGEAKRVLPGPVDIITFIMVSQYGDGGWNKSEDKFYSVVTPAAEAICL